HGLGFSASIEKGGDDFGCIADGFIDDPQPQATSFRHSPKGAQKMGPVRIGLYAFRLCDRQFDPRALKATFSQHLPRMPRELDPRNWHSMRYSAALGRSAPAARCLRASRTSIATIRPSPSKSSTTPSDTSSLSTTCASEKRT